MAEILPALPFETAQAPPGQEPPTYYVDENRQVMVLCPKCERARNLDFTQHPEVGPVIRTWCKCGNEYFCRLEFRRTYRKRVNLRGTFGLPDGSMQGDMTVTDISLGGVGMKLPTSYGLQPGMFLDVSFQLDNLKGTPIQRRVLVRTVHGLSIGAEFVGHRERDKDLGYYLMA
ncbi:putative type IV pilus assembly PilZ [Megalodesulfovibrio gigas DSM 1382 = ATCC 19364]|uniref:Putative type IV pilus assembly PilZ n=2 Tax=Megalodesulfovibrio gigas TaxID=879 RepID=T2GD49_MEGG1|nr:putative type IV pilus assembly PilZ [Megalodesulfovibrio gigas DSM 1382 = ATCC 19364]